ncbi:hypothetical protein [Polaromonas sp. UC242_47]|uniref:hypothetical protein n=1 Tax=Polaromonas sp. UC242_47 TaxID=3374626 RepID=UPI0037A230B2
MRIVHWCSAIAAVIWLVALAVGASGVFGVSSRDIPGYPNVEQIRYYLFYPGAVLMIVLGAWFFAANRPMRGFFAVGVALGSLVLFPFYFFYFTGGV